MVVFLRLIQVAYVIHARRSPTVAGARDPRGTAAMIKAVTCPRVSHEF